MGAHPGRDAGPVAWTCRGADGHAHGPGRARAVAVADDGRDARARTGFAAASGSALPWASALARPLLSLLLWPIASPPLASAYRPAP